MATCRSCLTPAAMRSASPIASSPVSHPSPSASSSVKTRSAIASTALIAATGGSCPGAAAARSSSTFGVMGARKSLHTRSSASVTRASPLRSARSNSNCVASANAPSRARSTASSTACSSGPGGASAPRSDGLVATGMPAPAGPCCIIANTMSSYRRMATSTSCRTLALSAPPTASSSCANAVSSRPPAPTLPPLPLPPAKAAAIASSMAVRPAARLSASIGTIAWLRSTIRCSAAAIDARISSPIIAWKAAALTGVAPSAPAPTNASASAFSATYSTSTICFR
mmetsp:Transcript_27179/g.94209  ORF Transcript_27179/g.94209 Transcript_27179/m.94209 type:complete len:284 (+) Transcript_27179:508-1359(+)